MFSRLTVFCAMAALPLVAGARDITVEVPPGETLLSEIGVYTICYQSYGKDLVEMPESWAGDFDTVSGIAYLPQERILGHDAMLLHSPWRVSAGKVWIDYRVSLPPVTPILLSFGIAMRPDAVEPNKSDGVTFSCYTVDGSAVSELMRQHQDKAEWRDYSFDLSAHSGRTVTIRLQTEPGPKNSPSFDFSYFGDAKLAVGTIKNGREDQVARLVASKALRATAAAGPRTLCNQPENGVVPSNTLPCSNSVSKAWFSDRYEFSYKAKDARVVYSYEPKTGTLDDFTVELDGARPFQPAIDGGVLVAVTEDGKPNNVRASGGKASKVELTHNPPTLTVLWDYTFPQPLQIRWEFGIVGKALTVKASCAQPVISQFSLGAVGAVPFRRILPVPYLDGQVAYLPAENTFVCRFLDWTVSNSSSSPRGTAHYETKTDGTRNPMAESGYISISPIVDEVLPNIPHPPSPWLNLLGPRVMLDIWGHNKGTYKGDGDNLRDLKDNGVDHVVIISHSWQRYGYDVKLPDHIPANPAFGGDEGMIEFGKAANECGYIWSLHENYIDLYPNAPSYDATARVLKADGSPSPAWFNQVQSYGLKCNRALDFARQNSPEIHKRYGTTAGYLDVHTCVPPWHQLDHEANQPMAAMARAKVKYDTELFQFMRDTHQGPLFGEGANQFYWAGRCDGVEAQVHGGENNVPFLDFDLLKIHPQMVNHGMGYYERWFARGYQYGWGQDAGTVEQVDKYRAQELAYGHAGFIGAAQVNNVQWVAKEHHLVHPVQALYGTAKPIEISYEVDGQFVPASVALVTGDRLRQRIRYDSGLTLWVNWKPEPWEVDGRLLPQWGFLALGPDTEVCTVLQDGKFADFADCPEYLFADARTHFNMPYLHKENDIEPRLKEFKHLGGDKISLTYEWTAGAKLDNDYHCFVHFTGAKDPEKILFQGDHTLPKPTSQWQAGDTITDGPYELQIPTDVSGSIDVHIGLFKDRRLQLKGVSTGGNRILIGRMEVTRKGGDIASVTLGDLAAIAKEKAVPAADFTAHLNPAGTRIDFGRIATDGSVKINKGKQNLTVFPYPRDTAFSVTLDLAALAPAADKTKVRVRALAAGTQADLGAVESSIHDSRLTFTTGLKGAGRFVIDW